jgi:D-alanyl-D-alanine dipeptidase/L,D-peptidoglycan transpeptidase YkuD (ErfK/YbiS/YcfS/YnhG family)
MRYGLSIVVVLISLVTAFPCFSQDASTHRQLLISLTGSWDDSRATVYRVEQEKGRWQLVGSGKPGMVGELGLAWDPRASGRDLAWPVKREGDLRAPAGIFRLPVAMGFAPLPPAGVMLPFRTIEEGVHCVDDRDSPWYNRIVSERGLPRPAAELWRSSERMWQLPDLYRLLLVVDYNRGTPVPGNGSCIFMHVWRGPDQATTGCTAMAEGDLAETVNWLRPGSDPALVQLPREVYRQVWREWRLPAPELLEGSRGQAGVPLVDVRSVAPGLVVEMRYAGPDNFTGKTVYSCGRCFLRPGTAAKVAKVAEELRKKKLLLKLWDCYRPLSVQKLFWALVPDPRYVADPRTGSRHNRGTAVDVTLADAEGRELAMPTGFDDFSPRAGHGETDLPAVVLANRRLLTETMQKAGFLPLQSEWWHYDDSEGGDGLLDVTFDELCAQDDARPGTTRSDPPR